MPAVHLVSQEPYLEAVLDAVVAGRSAPEPDFDDPWQLALASFVASEHLDEHRSAGLAQMALSLLTSDSPACVRVSVYGAAGLAASMGLVNGSWQDVAPRVTETGDPVSDAVRHLGGLQGGAPDVFARYLLAEAAITCGRVALAASLPQPNPHAFLQREGQAHSFATVFSVLAARIAAFGARIDDARAALTGVSSQLPRYALALDAARALVLGGACDPDATRGLAAEIEAAPAWRSRVSVGSRLLAAHGLIAIGELRWAARLILTLPVSGLEQLMTCDRGFVLEFLTQAALDEGDPDSADSWAAQAESYAASPIAGSSVARTRARVLLARGDFSAARAEAERAAGLARKEGRVSEVGQAELLVAKAALAARDGAAANRLLQEIAAEAKRTGNASLLRAAAHELRATGRRIMPLPGSEWDGLSEREREVGRLMLAGLSNAEIAEALFVSPHTIRAHVSRVLAAFGVASRFALVARTPLGSTGPPPQTGELTARQHEVVLAVAAGAGNAEIAEQLGISIKTVEKHLHDAMLRIGATSRIGVLRYAMANALADG